MARRTGTAWLNWPVNSMARRAGDKVCVTAPEKAAAPKRQKPYVGDTYGTNDVVNYG